MFAGILFGLVFGIPLAIVAARNRDSAINSVANVISVIGMAIPGFWLGMLLIWVFALQLKVLPASGYTPLTEDPVDNLRKLLMPAITLGVYELALVTRFLRAEMVEVLNSDYIRTARAKGIRERLVMSRHALKNALIPVVTIVGLQFGSLLGGAVTIETVFGRQGLGRILVDSVLARDYPMIQGCVLLAAVTYVSVNLIVDLAYAWIDPRITYE